jgi:hypothetical protein
VSRGKQSDRKQGYEKSFVDQCFLTRSIRSARVQDVKITRCSRSNNQRARGRQS